MLAFIVLKIDKDTVNLFVTFDLPSFINLYYLCLTIIKKLTYEMFLLLEILNKIKCQISCPFFLFFNIECIFFCLYSTCLPLLQKSLKFIRGIFKVIK